MRNKGIDLYRIVLTFMICILHMVRQGGLLYFENNGFLYYSIIWIINIICYCAVDGYALITGYNTIEKEINYSKLITLWFETFFYSFIFTLIGSLITFQKIQLNDLVKYIFPVTNNVFWYFSAFFPLAILKPFLTKILNKLNDKVIKIIFFVIIVVFSFIGNTNDYFYLDKGRSFIWLLLLFILGYSIKRLKLFNKLNNKLLLLFTIILITITFLYIIYFSSLILVENTSPTILLIAICLLIIFSRFNIKSKIIDIIAPTTFGIYLFQCNPFVWQKLSNILSFARNYNVIVVILIIVFSSLILFIFGFFIDYLRIRLFKLLKIDKLSSFINNKIIKLFNLL